MSALHILFRVAETAARPIILQPHNCMNYLYIGAFPARNMSIWQWIAHLNKTIPRPEKPPGFQPLEKQAAKVPTLGNRLYLTIGTTRKYSFVLSAGSAFKRKTGVAVVCGADGSTAMHFPQSDIAAP